MANHEKCATQKATFSNGLSIPVLGLGTWTSPPDKIDLAISSALEAGYRHIDTAFVYGNEKEIGDSLKKCMKKMNLKREDIFLTSKLWCTYFQPTRIREGFMKTLTDLQVDYLDLYLIHWPVAFKYGTENFPRASDGSFAVDDVDHAAIWRVLEELVDEGLVKSIGVSNFNRRQVDNIMKICRIKPVNNQVEIHANFPNTKLVDHCKSLGMTVTAYAPLGSPGASPGATNLLTVPWVQEIAKKHGKTPAQILTRYLLQRELIVVPKSVTPSRIVENMQVFDFTLSDEDMQKLNTSGLNERQFKLEGMKVHSEYPFSDEF